MNRITVAVCDTDHGYRDRFVAYLVEHKAKEYEVHAFSGEECFLETLKKQLFDIVIFGQGFAEAESQMRMQKIPFMVLKDIVPKRLEEGQNHQSKEEYKSMEVFRYQPMENILHEIQILMGAKPMEQFVTSEITRLEVIGVYSPIGHEMQMPFTLVLAGLLSEKRKVLYINFMRYSGFLELFGLTGEYDIGDIVLRLRNHHLSLETFLKCVYESNGMYYIPPFYNPENLDDFVLDDYLALLKFLEDRTDFEVVVFDFGDGIEQLAEVLKNCTNIYCPTKTGFFYQCQLNQFVSYVEQGELEVVQNRLHIVKLPFSAKQIRAGSDVRRQLLWSEFGDYIREYFAGGCV